MAVISKKSWIVQKISTKERFDIKCSSAEAVTDKRFVESLKWRSEEIIFVQKALGGLHCQCNAYHQELERIDEVNHAFRNWYYSLECDLTTDVNVFLLQTIKKGSVQFASWILGPFSKTMSAQKSAVTLHIKTMIIFHVRCDLWWPCTVVISQSQKKKLHILIYIYLAEFLKTYLKMHQNIRTESWR